MRGIKPRAKRGRLQIWLGYSAGIGKTYTMLGVAHRLLERGEDLVGGVVETHGRTRVQALMRGIEMVPRRAIEHRDATFEEMDVDGIIERNPTWVIVDELAHTNVPGSRNEKRWQDVDDILDAGISVLSTVNIQHLESLNDTVERITGVAQREIVPDSVVRAADQIDLVDVAPDALRRRLARGDIYPPEKVDAALGNHFREGNLTALRELALLWLADRVDEELLDYMDRYEISGTWETRERIAVAVSGKDSDLHLVRRAARMAARRGSEFMAVHVVSGSGGREGEELELSSIADVTRDLGGTYREIVGTDEGEVGEALLEFARAEHATQLVLGASSRSRLAELFQGSIINKIIRSSGSIDIHVISQEGPAGQTPIPRRSTSAIPRRRQLLGGAVAVIGLPLLTWLLTGVRDQVGLPGTLLLFLSLVIGVAAIGGLWPALGAAVGASLLVNYFFTPPIHTWTIADPHNVLALGVFLCLAAGVSTLVSLEARNRVVAARRRAESDALAQLARAFSEEDDPLPVVLRHLQLTFGLHAAAVLVEDPDGAATQRTAGWRAEASIGTPAIIDPDGGVAHWLDDETVLVMRGDDIPADQQRLLAAFIAEITVALRFRRLASQAASAEQQASLNELRSAILDAVSHDLRTPLSSIKMAASSLRETDVSWTDEQRAELLQTVEEGTDRLNRIVGNLLDMSRLNAGAVPLLLSVVGLDEVTHQAVRSLPDAADRLDVQIPEDLPRVRVDPGLLERAIANVTDNAITWSPPAGRVTLSGSTAADRVELRIVDRGPGVPEDRRHEVFQPFQRFGDRPREGGLGLGMAVAKGLTEAIGGTIDLEDTPGGGLTVVLSFGAVT